MAMASKAIEMRCEALVQPLELMQLHVRCSDQNRPDVPKRGRVFGVLQDDDRDGRAHHGYFDAGTSRSSVMRMIRLYSLLI